ncbi:MAG: hypothetical protein GF388_03510 [Candidatus Aegiribacteria sp.]|nr:hypothetical protein [Candidatus Aegiribacteria sp.]
MMLVLPLLADSPADNDIPTLAMRLVGPDKSLSDFTLEFICGLSWLNFDAVNFAGWADNQNMENLMSLCDSSGVYFALCPSEIMQYFKGWADEDFQYWFRNSQARINSSQAYSRCDSTFDAIADYLTADSMYSADTTVSIRTTIGALSSITREYEYLWFYEVYDEANSKQGKNVAQDPDSLAWDDYLPNVYTQARDSVTGYLTLEEVEPSGIFSLQKYYTETDSLNPLPFTMNFGLLHSIDSTDYLGIDPKGWTTMATQATCVRAMMEAEYQFPPPDNDSLVDNSPEFILFDYYPFRYVDIDYQSTTAMCDTNWLFLVEHFEEGIDSTVIPAHESDCPVFYLPQTFGVAGGGPACGIRPVKFLLSNILPTATVNLLLRNCVCCATLPFYTRPRGSFRTTYAATLNHLMIPTA